MPQKSVWFSKSSITTAILVSKVITAVTGTASGLGNALVHELLDAGHSVVACSRRPEILQAELKNKYQDTTLDRILVVKLDVTDPEDVKIAFAQALNKFQRIDVVVNNAGYVSSNHSSKPFPDNSSKTVVAEVEASPIGDARAQFEVMFWGVVHVSKEVSKS